MENFVAYNPTILHFGKGVVNDLGKAVEPFGKRVLLVYGKGSVKKTGLYDKVIGQLKAVNTELFEYSGIKSNPVIEDVDAAAEVGRKNRVDVIVAVGGGSVIDSAKIISITIPVTHSGWDFYSGKAKPATALPVIAILTLAATGTEMNPFAVQSNHKTKIKEGFHNSFLYPRHSFLDPQNTVSVPRNYTAYGIADLIAHALEAYFGAGDATLSDRFIFSIINEAMENGPKLLDNLHDYDLRAKIMYAANTALNGFTMYGKANADWGVHSLGHILSLMFDIPHGASLSIAYPAWMKTLKDRMPERLELLGKNVFGTSSPDETISRFEAFFQKIDCPVHLQQAGILPDKKQEIYDLFIRNNVGGTNYQLSKEEVKQIVDYLF